MGLCTPFIDSNYGDTIVCTSGSRPDGPDLYAGRWIFETDTLRTLYYDGTGWVIMDEPTQTYSPTWGNLTVNDGTLTANYHRSGGFCDLFISLTFGGTTSITGNVTVTTPIAAAYQTVLDYAGIQASFYDNSGSQLYPLVTFNSSTTLINLYAMASASTYVNISPFSATVPVAYGSSDRIALAGRYQMTTKYS